MIPIKTERRNFESRVLPQGQKAIDTVTDTEYVGDGVTPGGVIVEADTIYATAAEIAATTYPKGQRVYDLTNNVVVFGDGTVGGSSSGITKMTTAEREAVTPAAGALVYDTDLGTYWGGDGTTSGGTSLAAGGGGGGVQSVKAAYVSNVADLGSPGNADGVSISDGDEVLLIAQTDASENGIYVNNSGTLERHTDYDNDADFQNKSVLVFIREGDTLADQLYHTDGASDFELGTDDMVWEDYRDLSIGDVAGLQTALDGKSDTGHAHVVGDVTGLQTALDGKSDTGHTHDVEDLTNKPSFVDVDVVTTGNIPNLASPGAATDGVTYTEGMRVFVAKQSDTSENGFYLYSSGSGLTRDPRYNASAAYRGRAFLVSVAQGTIGSNQLYRFKCSPTFELDTDTTLINEFTDWFPAISTAQKGIERAADTNEIGAQLIQSNDERVPVLCAVATVGNIDISANAAASYDGYTLVNLDLVLVKDQTDASENGVYVWTGTGSPMNRMVGLHTSASWSNKKRVIHVLNGTLGTGVYFTQEGVFTLDTDDLEVNLVQIVSPDERAAIQASDSPSATNPLVTQSGVDPAILEYLRGTANKHLGAYPNQPFRATENVDNSAFTMIRQGNLFIVTSEGALTAALGLAVQTDSGEPDLEVVLLDGSRISAASLDSDKKALNGLPFKQEFQSPSLGAYAANIVLDGGTF